MSKNEFLSWIDNQIHVLFDEYIQSFERMISLSMTYFYLFVCIYLPEHSFYLIWWYTIHIIQGILRYTWARYIMLYTPHTSRDGNLCQTYSRVNYRPPCMRDYLLPQPPIYCLCNLWISGHLEWKNIRSLELCMSRPSYHICNIYPQTYHFFLGQFFDSMGYHSTASRECLVMFKGEYWGAFFCFLQIFK